MVISTQSRNMTREWFDFDPPRTGFLRVFLISCGQHFFFFVMSDSPTWCQSNSCWQLHHIMLGSPVFYLKVFLLERSSYYPATNCTCSWDHSGMGEESLEISTNSNWSYCLVQDLFYLQMAQIESTWTHVMDLSRLKEQCHEIFCFWFISWISFPPAPEYSI
jgi:hypothetical protein